MLNMRRIATSAKAAFTSGQHDFLQHELRELESHSFAAWKKLGEEINTVHMCLDNADKYVENEKSSARKKEAAALQSEWKTKRQAADLKAQEAQLNERIKELENRLHAYEGIIE